MRYLLLAVLAALVTVSVSAQTLYLRDGQRGIAPSVVVGHSEGNTSVGFALTGTVYPGLDVTAEYARIPDGGLTIKAAGASVAFYPIRTGADRIGVALGLQRLVNTGFGDATLGSVGLVVGRRVDVTPLVTVAPHVTIALPFVLDDGRQGSGLSFVGSATPTVLIGTGTVRLAVEPSISYGFETRTTAVSAAIGFVAAL